MNNNYKIKDLKIGRQFTTNVNPLKSIWEITDIRDDKLFYKNLMDKKSYQIDLKVSIENYFNKGHWYFISILRIDSSYGRLKRLFYDR